MEYIEVKVDKPAFTSIFFKKILQCLKEFLKYWRIFSERLGLFAFFYF